MAIALPSSMLHRLAAQHIPNLPIREGATWVAILNHTCKALSDIKDGDSFIWIKANKNITVRTLQFHYYQRHPLEDLALQFRDTVPPETTTVGQIRDIRLEDNLAVFRALEADTVTSEDLRRGIDYNAKLKLAGRDVQHVISLDSDDEDEEEPDLLTNGWHEDTDQDAGRDARSEDEHEAEDADAGTKADSSCTVRPDPEVLVISDDEDANHESEDDSGEDDDGEMQHTRKKHVVLEVQPAEAKANQEAPAEEVAVPQYAMTSVSAHMRDHLPETTAKRCHIVDIETPDETAIKRVRASPFINSTPVYSLHNLPRPTIDINSLEEFKRGAMPPGVLARVNGTRHDVLNAVQSTSSLQCENWECRLNIRVKPWTCIGPRGGLLCTTCSRVWLMTHGVPEALSSLDAALELEQRHKVEWDAMGFSQIMDYDAPIKVPFEQCAQTRDRSLPVSLGSLFNGNNARMDAHDTGYKTIQYGPHNSQQYAGGSGSLYNPYATNQQTTESVQYGPHDVSTANTNPVGHAPFYQSTSKSLFTQTQPNRDIKVNNFTAQSMTSASAPFPAPTLPQSPYRFSPNNEYGRPENDPLLSPTQSFHTPPDMSTSPEPDAALGSASELKIRPESPILGKSPPPNLTFDLSPNHAQLNNASGDVFADHDTSYETSGMIQGMQGDDEEQQQDQDDYIDQQIEDDGAKDDPEDEDYDEDGAQGEVDESDGEWP